MTLLNSLHHRHQPQMCWPGQLAVDTRSGFSEFIRTNSHNRVSICSKLESASSHYIRFQLIWIKSVAAIAVGYFAQVTAKQMVLGKKLGFWMCECCVCAIRTCTGITFQFAIVCFESERVWKANFHPRIDVSWWLGVRFPQSIRHWWMGKDSYRCPTPCSVCSPIRMRLSVKFIFTCGCMCAFDQYFSAWVREGCGVACIIIRIGIRHGTARPGFICVNTILLFSAIRVLGAVGVRCVPPSLLLVLLLQHEFEFEFDVLLLSEFKMLF